MRKENTFNQGLDENLICRSLDACLRKRGMTGGKYIRKLGMTLFVYCLLSGVAHAECVPAPDCASIGYTATSCDGVFLRCPFDISKLLCMPCDSSYKYDCSGENITGGVGSACGGKYVSCSCSGGATFNDGACPQNCTVGMIYYSDKSCSSTNDSSKTAIGVVVKDNELVMNLVLGSNMVWSSNVVDTSLTNYESNGSAITDFNGKSNTITVLAEDSGTVAAKYCNDYTTTGTNAGDWYLPAAGELYHYVYGNYSAINTAMISIGSDKWWFAVWSSSEDESNAWVVNPYDGNVSITGKQYTVAVRCFLAL